MNIGKDSNRFVIIDSPTKEEMKVIQEGIDAYNRQQPYGELDVPENDIVVVLKTHDETVVGGVITSMKFGVMHLEVLWVDDKYRSLGYGRDLILEAERIGREKGYTSSQTWTFSFQAPEFYQKIGYKILGIFDGYTDNITEYVLMKRLNKDYQAPVEDNHMNQDGGSRRFTVSEGTTEESIKILHAGLGKFVAEHVGELRKNNPEIEIKLVIKNHGGDVIGGIRAGTTLKTMYIENLWIDEKYRGRGYGKELMMESERRAKENGCISGQTWVMSFHSPEFFQKLGYDAFGVSNGYPESIMEFYFIKRF
ncbi:MAG: GNAT family N-acetyltransferase [Candidatus Thorarchaeota archaeon]